MWRMATWTFAGAAGPVRTESYAPVFGYSASVEGGSFDVRRALSVPAVL